MEKDLISREEKERILIKIERHVSYEGEVWRLETKGLLDAKLLIAKLSP